MQFMWRSEIWPQRRVGTLETPGRREEGEVSKEVLRLTSAQCQLENLRNSVVTRQPGDLVRIKEVSE